MAQARKAKTQERAVPLTPALDKLLHRSMELRLNLSRETQQEQQAVMQGLLLPIRATRRAAMLQRAIKRTTQALLRLPVA